jgi:hypothetical protein
MSYEEEQCFDDEGRCPHYEEEVSDALMMRGGVLTMKKSSTLMMRRGVPTAQYNCVMDEQCFDDEGRCPHYEKEVNGALMMGGGFPTMKRSSASMTRGGVPTAPYNPVMDDQTALMMRGGDPTMKRSRALMTRGGVPTAPYNPVMDD